MARPPVSPNDQGSNPDRAKMISWLREAPRPKGKDLECCIAALTHVQKVGGFSVEESAQLVYDYWRSQDFSDMALIQSLSKEANHRLSNPKNIDRYDFGTPKPAPDLNNASALGNTITGRLVSSGNGYRVGYAFGLANMDLRALPPLTSKIIGESPAVFETAAKIGLADGLRVRIQNEDKLYGSAK